MSKLHITLLILLLTLAACNSNQQTTSSATATPDKVVMQFNWIHNNAWSGFYIAEKDGLYQQENLDVELRIVFDEEGNFIDTAQAVIDGQAQFGIIPAEQLLMARAEGKPLVAVATIYQQHPLVLLSLAGKGITKPDDLINARAHISGNSRVAFDALLAAANVDAAQVEVIERTDFTIQPLLNDSADIIDGWVTNELPIIEASGEPYNTIFLSDYGIEMYPNLIFTTEDLIQNNPGLVERFVRATVRGLQGAVDDPEKGAQLAVEYNSELDQAAEAQSLLSAVPLITPAGGQPGMMTAEAWEQTQTILIDLGILAEPVDLSAAYTLAFLDKVYEGVER